VASGAPEKTDDFAFATAAAPDPTPQAFAATFDTPALAAGPAASFEAEFPAAAPAAATASGDEDEWAAFETHAAGDDFADTNNSFGDFEQNGATSASFEATFDAPADSFAAFEDAPVSAAGSFAAFSDSAPDAFGAFPAGKSTARPVVAASTSSAEFFSPTTLARMQQAKSADAQSSGMAYLQQLPSVVFSEVSLFSPSLLHLPHC
jgi:hypothetical protein